MNNNTTINKSSEIIVNLLKKYLIINIDSIDISNTKFCINIKKSSTENDSDLESDLINKVLYYNSEIYDNYAFEYMNETSIDYTIYETESIIYINFKIV